VDALHAELAGIFASGTTLVVDLSDATFIDSSILGELFRSKQAADAKEGEELALVAPAGGVAARLFALVDMRSVCQVFESRAKALERVGIVVPRRRIPLDVRDRIVQLPRSGNEPEQHRRAPRPAGRSDGAWSAAVVSEHNQSRPGT
jgi:anti-anti-sigma regulatory factor